MLNSQLHVLILTHLNHISALINTTLIHALNTLQTHLNHSQTPSFGCKFGVLDKFDTSSSNKHNFFVSCPF
ncbi:hypothetical protein Hdeb2414_s0004g00139161 [Helianthus debilis subsp. tardiflorus]